MRLNPESKVWAVLGIALALLRMLSFYRHPDYGFQLLAIAGFLLIAIGAILNGFQKLDYLSTSSDKRAVAGFSLIIAGFALVASSAVWEFNS